MLARRSSPRPKNVGETGGRHDEPRYLGENGLSAKDELSKVGQDKAKAYSGEPIPELDAAGTELGKEARVWKIYVKQSDHWDSELVDGWNKSLDVILVFAALFSAISTAFLIESSKMLRGNEPDPTAQVLSFLLQAQLANSTNLSLGPNPLTDFLANSTTSSPSHADAGVLINTLWYLSLSLSVLTSFLAMLAKDWCHSFMAGRTGHPYLQTRRRQQKWMMIKKWKMQELITVLPSVIHLSLLLFAVGLCIYVWKLNSTVATPVVCVTTLAATFYAWSGVMATLVDFFPYTTIVSRILLSDGAKSSCKILRSLLQYTWPFVRSISDFGAWCLLSILDFLYENTNWSTLKEFLEKERDSLRQWASKLYLAPSPKPRTVAGSEEDRSTSIAGSEDDDITSLALSWLISNCEEPTAVDAALQAISGASHLALKPLEECNASLKISRRLVSEDIYMQANSPRVLLYARALSYLNTKEAASTLASTNTQNKNPGELEVLIWRLQGANNNRVANLITDGRFMPTTDNFEALRIGCTSAAQVLANLSQGRRPNLPSLDLLSNLLDEYIRDRQTLHPAALLALLNAGFLLTTCFPDSSNFDITAIAIMLLHDKLKIPGRVAIEPQLGISLVAYIALKAELSLPCYSSQHNSRHLEDSLHQIAKRLTQWSQNPQYEEQIIWLGISVISSSPTAFIQESQSTELHGLQKWAVASYRSTFECLPGQDHLINHDAVFEFLETLEEMYTPIMIGTPTPHVYYFVVESMCRDRSSGYAIWESAGKLLSKFSFPILSAELIDWLADKERNIIPLLRASLGHNKYIIRFLAASQLWCLFTLCANPSVETRSEEQVRLEAFLSYNPDGRAPEAAVDRSKLASIIDRFWRKEKSEICKWLGSYAYRVCECLLEDASCPLPSIERGEMEEQLRGIPFGLRGLDSFLRLSIIGDSHAPDEPHHPGVIARSEGEEPEPV